MRQTYPSDITKAQFVQIRVVLYLLKSGCQWHMLPEVFLKWNPFIIISASGMSQQMEA